jgi:hypothetical protein
LKGSFGDISNKIYQQVIGDHLKSVSLDRLLLQVFLKCDGSRTIEAVAQAINREPASLKDAVARLLELDLIRPVTAEARHADEEFFLLLNQALSKAIGPIAPVLIEEEIEAMGQEPARFPNELAADLVDALAREIQPENKRNEFQITMVRLLRNKGYAG